jgi:hypothetical protein
MLPYSWQYWHGFDIFYLDYVDYLTMNDDIEMTKTC